MRKPTSTVDRGGTARLRAAIVALAAALCLTACAAPQLAYQKLGWLASWKLGQYVDLDAAQEREFETNFRDLWDWHRANELSGYGQDLRELARATRQPMSSEAVRSWAVRAEAHSQRVLERGMSPACTLLSSFDDSQRDSALERIDHDIEKDAEKYLDGSESEIRKQARKRMRKSLERWVGDLDDSQEEMLKTWSLSRPLRYRQWIEERRQWRERLARVLDQRADPDFCDRLQALVLRPREEQDGDLVNQAGARAWIEFLSSFSATLDEQQRDHLHDKLVELASDFETLKGQS